VSDLQADLERIKKFSKDLNAIHTEFTQESNPADGYGTQELGSRTVVDAFGDFSSNWKIHRERLTDELKTLRDLSAAAAENFEAIDKALADALRGEDKKNGTSRSPQGPR
jgi:hypothetical protein